MTLSSHWQIGINVKLSAFPSLLIQIESPVMWLQSSSINTFTWPLNLRLLLFPAGTSAALSASSPCCHGDESWHKRQAGRHDVSQDLHPKARQRQVTIRGWSVTGRSWSGIFRALLPVWLSTQRASEYTVTNNAFSQQSPQKQCMFAPWGPIHISLVFNVFMFCFRQYFGDWNWTLKAFKCCY